MSHNTLASGRYRRRPLRRSRVLPQPPGPPSGSGRDVGRCSSRRNHRRGHRQCRGRSHHSEGSRHHRSDPDCLTPVTVTVAAPTPAPPAPLPTSQADRQTCRQGWINAGNLIKSAQAAVTVLPPDVKVGDPATALEPRVGGGSSSCQLLPPGKFRARVQHRTWHYTRPSRSGTDER